MSPDSSDAIQHAAASADFVGRALPRREDEAILRGQGAFVDDLHPPGCLHAAFARSPYARGRIRGLDTSAASSIDGVHLVVTGNMLADIGTLPVNPIIAGIRAFAVPLLATDRVNAVGAPVAVVIAESASIARHAAEAIVLDCESLPAYPDTASALAGEPLLAGWPDNIAFEKRWQAGAYAAAAARAAHVIDVDLRIPRVAAVALETRGILVDWSQGRLSAWLSTQSPHRARAHLAQILGLELAHVRTIAADVGGAFGSKASLYPEDVVVAFAAMRLGRPVKWIASRNDDMIAGAHGRDARIAASGCFDAQGHLLGVRADLTYALGSWATFSAVVPAVNAARILPGPYSVDHVDITARGVVTNTAPVGIYRGAGRPEAAMVMERLMDRAAQLLELDPAEVRRRNLVRATAMPFRTPTGQTLDSGDYAALMHRALEVAGYAEHRAQQRERRANGELVGIGINVYVEPCGTGWESARITRHPHGRFVVASGSSAQGQGHRTAFAQIAADALRVDIARVEVVEGDSETSPPGIGAVASRSIAIGGSAIRLAAQRMLEMLLDPTQAAQQIIVAEAKYTALAEAWSAGCCIVFVAIDEDTGELTVQMATWVDDAGIIINPLLADGQLAGGFAQGLGQALMEQIHYDEDGQITTGSLLDYALPRAVAMPPLTLASLPSTTTANELGAKGVGESGCIAAPAAILNAAIDALSPLGVTHLDIPLTSENLWRAIQRSRQPP